MATLSISLLGPFQASLDDFPLTHFRTLKVQALLVYLAAEQEASHHRETLMDLLWPGLPEKSARTNLRQILYQLRKTIPQLDSISGKGQVPFLRSEGQFVRINPDALVDLDLTTFSELIAESLAHPHSDLLTCARCEARLEQAVGLYRGNFLADLFLDDSNRYENWAQAKREAFQRQMMDALDILAAMQLKQERFAQAQAYARRQLELDSLNERALRQLMEALARNGQRSEALAAYESARDQLQREIGMAPTAKTNDLSAQIRDDELGISAAPGQAMRGYEVLDEIGAGVFGVVHLAHQTSIGRQVAVKIIKPRYANQPEFIRRFEAEARAIARLEHPHIVPLHDFWREPDRAYLVMRLLKGGNLADSLARGKWPPASAAAMIDQISSALALAHSRGVVHRDIKPANILLDEARNAYLADFGIAIDLPGGHIGAQHTAQWSLSSYVSPEQALNEAVSPLSDQYSLGVVLYEVLSGESAPARVSQEHREPTAGFEPLPELSGRIDGLPPAVDSAIRRATAYQPEDRFPDIQAFASAFREAAGVREASIQPSRSSKAGITITNPYKGLRAFQEEDAEFFFGRSNLVERLVDRMRETRFLAVVGPSGSGKSSAVKAGLIPALRRGALVGSESWFIAEISPGAYPLEELEAALLSVAVNPPASLKEPMEQDERGLGRVLKRVLPYDSPKENPPQLLLVIDQFEELFTLVEDRSSRDRFLASLLSALREPQSRLRLVITLRADFYDRPLQLPDWGELVREHTEIVLPLTAAELQEAITGPANQVGARLEPGLAGAMAAEVADQPGALPLLQFALAELFENRSGDMLTWSAYESIGGVRGALIRRAEEIYLSLGETGREAARQLFLRLVSIGAAAETTRRRVLLHELSTVLEDESPAHRRVPLEPEKSPITVFGRHHLLTFDRDPATRSPTVEMAHEALLGAWPRLEGWLAEGRDDIRMQRQLDADARGWIDAGEDPSYLLRGARLASFQAWAEDTTIALTQQEQQFLEASVHSHEEIERQEERRREREIEVLQQLANTERDRAEEQARTAHSLRRRALYLGIAGLTALLLAVAAGLFARQASLNQIVAEKQTALAVSRELSQASINALESDPELSILLALEALEIAYTREAEEALHKGLQRTRALISLKGHDAEVFGAMFSPDGRLVATASNDGTLKIWNASNGEVVHDITFRGVEYMSRSMQFDRAGSTFAMLTVQQGFGSLFLNVWDTDTGEIVRQNELPIQVRHFFQALSPDNALILTGVSEGKTAQLWDTQDGELLRTFQGHDDEVIGVAFSPDGEHLVTTSLDGRVQVWNIADALENEAAAPAVSFVSSNQEPLRGVVFSPDGGSVALRFEFSVEIWNLADSDGPVATLRGHTDFVEHMAMDPTGGRLATASTDGTARVWDLRTGEALIILAGHRDAVSRLSFSPDGNRLATSSLDGTAKIWTTGPHSGSELGAFSAEPDPMDLHLSPDSSIIATGSRNGPARLWDAATGLQLATLVGETGADIYRVAFHPHGHRIAGSSSDGRITVWDVNTGERLLSFIGHTGGSSSGIPGALDVAFSPDGIELASAGADGLVKIWDAESGLELRSMYAGGPGLLSLAYSPDGRYLAASGDLTYTTGEQGGIFTTVEGSNIRVWDAQTGEETHVLGPAPAEAWALAFSPDSRTLATSGPGGFLKAWDLDTGAEILDVFGPQARLSSLAFAPNGRDLISGSPGGIIVWDIVSGLDRALLSSENSFEISLSPDGSRLYAIARGSGTVRIYTVPLEEAITLARDRLSRDLTEAECRQYLHLDSCPPDV